MHIRKIIKQYWRQIILGLAVINGIVFFGVRYFMTETTMQSMRQASRDRGDYLTLSTGTDKQDSRTAPAYLKRGAINTARDLFLSPGYSTAQTRQETLRKAMFLRSKGEINGVQQMLETVTDPDPRVRSLFLGVRAYMLCAEKKRADCAILANDSNVLDPLSAFSLLVAGISNSAKRQFVAAEEFFQRAEKLDGMCEESMCRYYRGMTRFYAGTYTGAIEDLLLARDDEKFAYEANLFLGRVYLLQKEYDNASEQFMMSRSIRGGVDWTSELWLARVALAQDDQGKAMQIYQQISLTGSYGLELLTDYLKLSYFQGNQLLTDQLLTYLHQMTLKAPWEYLHVATIYRLLHDFDQATALLQQGRALIEGVEEERSRESIRKDFAQEEEHLLIQRLYDSLTQESGVVTGTVIFSGSLLVSGTVLFDELVRLREAQGGNAQKIAFFRGLQQVMVYGEDTTGSGFQLIKAITPDDLQQIRLWYVLFRGDAKRALQILTEIPTQQENSQKILWMKRAVTTRFGEKQLADKYLNQLKEQGLLPPTLDLLSLQALRKEAFRAFSPRMQWMMPYFPVDSRWIRPGDAVFSGAEGSLAEESF